MFLAEVRGTVVSPVQHPVLEGRRLLLVQPVDPSGQDRGPTRIAIDLASAAPGERVLVVDEGNAGRQLLDCPDGPVKTVVVGIVDYVEIAGRLTYSHDPPAAAR